MTQSNFVLSCGVALLLAACGGGSSQPVADNPPAADTVPASASASPAGMAAWMTGLAVTPSDTQEPLDATTFMPPSPDDTEPEALK